MKVTCLCATGPDRFPDLNCGNCNGTGLFEAAPKMEDDVVAQWIARCPECGASNGWENQRAGEPEPRNKDPHWRCTHEECSHPKLEFVRVDAVTAWSALCRSCSKFHYADFQQLANDKPPTLATRPRICPHCRSAKNMSWHLDTDLKDMLDW